MLNFTSWQLSTSKYKIKQYMQLEPRIKTNRKKTYESRNLKHVHRTIRASFVCPLKTITDKSKKTNSSTRIHDILLLQSYIMLFPILQLLPSQLQYTIMTTDKVKNFMGQPQPPLLKMHVSESKNIKPFLTLLNMNFQLIPVQIDTLYFKFRNIFKPICLFI